MKYEVLNKQGKKEKEISLPKDIFDVKVNADLVHQVVVSQMSNRRKLIAHSKGRAEVRGGGRKPWRQKGLGRARHGSIRSPIWVGGGVTFGPTKERNYKKTIPKKMRRAAFFMALSDKARNKSLVLIDELKTDKIKTSDLVKVLGSLPSKGRSSLIALPGLDKKLILSARNIVKTKTIQAKDLNCLDVVSFEYLIMPQESIKVIEDTFSKR